MRAYRVVILLCLANVAFPLGMLAFDALHPHEAEASGGMAGGAIPRTGSGGLVGASGPIALTGPVSITGALSCTLGVSAATGVFSGAVSATGAISATGALSTASTLSVTSTSTLTGNVAMGGTCAITGALSSTGNLSTAGNLTVSGNALVTGTLGVTGAVSITGATTIAPASGVALTLTGVNGSNTLTATATTSGSAINGTGAGSLFGVVGTGGGTDPSNNYGAVGVKGIASKGAGVWGTASSGYAGVIAENTVNGRGLVVYADATSPTNGQVYIQPGDATPSGPCLLGELAVVPNGVTRMCVNTSPLYDAIANHGVTCTFAAAGSVQSDSTLFTAGCDFANVTAANGTTGVQLRSGVNNQCLRIMNASASALKVYGNNSDNDTINGGAADALYSQVAGSSLIYCTADSTAWLTY